MKNDNNIRLYWIISLVIGYVLIALSFSVGNLIYSWIYNQISESSFSFLRIIIVAIFLLVGGEGLFWGALIAIPQLFSIRKSLIKIFPWLIVTVLGTALGNVLWVLWQNFVAYLYLWVLGGPNIMIPSYRTIIAGHIEFGLLRVSIGSVLLAVVSFAGIGGLIYGSVLGGLQGLVIPKQLKLKKEWIIRMSLSHGTAFALLAGANYLIVAFTSRETFRSIEIFLLPILGLLVGLGTCNGAVKLFRQNEDGLKES